MPNKVTDDKQPKCISPSPEKVSLKKSFSGGREGGDQTEACFKCCSTSSVPFAATEGHCTVQTATELENMLKASPVSRAKSGSKEWPSAAGLARRLLNKQQKM